MAVMLADFLKFPDAERFPAGPYDLEGLFYSTAGHGSFQLDIRLGYVYDFYLLQIIADEPARWELWHQDSAVMHVDEHKVADNPPFLCAAFSTPCDIALKILINHELLESRAQKLTFCPAPAEKGFEIEFALESGPTLCLSSRGWRMKNDAPSDSS